MNTHRQRLAPIGCRTGKQKAALLAAHRTRPPAPLSILGVIFSPSRFRSDVRGSEEGKTLFSWCFPCPSCSVCFVRLPSLYRPVVGGHFCRPPRCACPCSSANQTVQLLALVPPSTRCHVHSVRRRASSFILPFQMIVIFDL